MSRLNLEKGRSFLKQHKKLLLTLLFLLLIVLLIIYHFSKKKASPDTRIHVVTAKARKENVPVFLMGLGTVTSLYTVTVKTQISGILMQVLFQEGQLVKAGDLLAQIDDRYLNAQLMQYEGQLARDTAQLANALIDYNRYQKLWRQDSIAQQTYATQAALVKELRGTIKLDQGLIAGTKVNLIYTKITSPIDGRIGLRLVDPGNIVQISDSTPIAVVNMVNPITVIFTLPEDNVSEVMAKLNAKPPLNVDALDRQQNKLLATGELLTVDNQINTATGTVKLKAVFKNDKNTLFPNQFVNARLLIKTLENATTIPTAAIQYTSEGAMVFLVNANGTVSSRMIEPGVAYLDHTVVNKGLMPNQEVVIEGADNLLNGSKVITAPGTQTTLAVNKSTKGSSS